MSKMRWIALLTILILVVSFILVPFSANSQNATTSKPPSDVEFKLRKEMMTFVPYRELDRLLESNKKLVYISYQELKKLIESKSQIRPLAPINYVIKDLALDGKANKNYISFTATYKIQILNKEWVYVPIMTTQVGLKSATLDGKPAPVSIDGGNFRILSDSLGEHVLKLNFDVKITESGNTRNFSFNMPNLPITRLTITVPEANVRLNIANASGQRMEVKNGNTITSANLIGQGSVTVDWKTSGAKVTTTPKQKVKVVEDTRPSRVISEVHTLISVDEGIMQGVSTYNCQIIHRPIERLTIAIPDNLEIIDVSSPNNIVQKGPPNITDPNGSAPGRLLTVYFNSRIKDQAVFSVAFEKTFDNTRTQEVKVPDLILTGKEIVKIIGFVAVQSTGNIEVQQVKIANITPIDSTELPAALDSSAQNPILLAYTFTNEPFNLDLNLIPHKDAPVQVAFIDGARIDSRLSNNGVFSVKGTYKIRNMSEQYFKFQLPKGADKITGAIDNMPVKVEIEKSEKIVNPDRVVPKGVNKNNSSKESKPVQIEKEKNDSTVKKGKAESSNDSVYLINIKNYQNSNPFVITIMFEKDYGFNKLNGLVNIFKLEAPVIKNIQTENVSWEAWIPDGMRYWSFTNMKRGYNPQPPDISSNVVASSGEVTVPTQSLSNVQTSVTDAVGGKTVGVIPPIRDLPGTDGLRVDPYWGYLLSSNTQTINYIAVNDFFNILFFVGIVILTWYIAEYLRRRLPVAQSYQQRAYIVVPIVLGIYILGMMLGHGLVWIAVILTSIIYLLNLKFRWIKTN